MLASTLPSVSRLDQRSNLSQNEETAFPALFRDDLLISRGERNLFAESFVTLQPQLHLKAHNYVNRREKKEDGKELRHQLKEDSKNKENGVCRSSCWWYYHHRPRVGSKA